MMKVLTTKDHHLLFIIFSLTCDTHKQKLCMGNKTKTKRNKRKRIIVIENVYRLYIYKLWSSDWKREDVKLDAHHELNKEQTKNKIK